jgi:hypothetical protein
MQAVVWCPEGFVTYSWHYGGPYIEVTLPGYTVPSDVINVYDYAAGRSSIQTSRDFESEVWQHHNWLLANDGDELYRALEACRY